jgi:hypothetical protein
MYALRHGLPHVTAQLVTALAVTTIAASIVVHGISVTPLDETVRQADANN